MSTTTHSNIARIPFDVAIKSLRAAMLHQWSTGIKGLVHIWLGPPGFGKTSVPQAIAREIHAMLGGDFGKLLILVPTLADLEVPDISGHVVPTESEPGSGWDITMMTRSCIPPLPHLEAHYDRILIIIDEYTGAGIDHMKAARPGVLEYRFGNTKLDPKKYFIMATGNRQCDKAGANSLTTHTTNGMAVREIEPTVRPFLDWAAIPENNVPSVVRAYVNFDAGEFQNMVVPTEKNAPFMTVRSLLMGVIDMLVSLSDDPSKPLDLGDPMTFANALSADNLGTAEVLLAGSVGLGHAKKFLSFARIIEKLTPLEAVKRDPLGCHVPTELNAAFAQVGYLVSWTQPSRNSEAKATNVAILRFLARMSPEMVPSTLVALEKRFTTANALPALTALPEYADLSAKHSRAMRHSMAA
jgi:hypothetical protein